MPKITPAMIRAVQANPRIHSYVDVPGNYTRPTVKGKLSNFWVNKADPSIRFTNRAFLSTQRAVTQTQFEKIKVARKEAPPTHLVERVNGWQDYYLKEGADLGDVAAFVRSLLPNRRVWVVAHGSIRIELGSPGTGLQEGSEYYEGWLTVLSNCPVREFNTPDRQAKLHTEVQAFNFVDQILIRVKDQG